MKQTNIRMSKRGLASIEARTELRGTTQLPNNKKCKRPKALGENFTRDTTQQNITIVTYKCEEPLLLENACKTQPRH